MTSFDDLPAWQKVRFRISRIFWRVPMKGNVHVRVFGEVFSEHGIDYDDVFARIKSAIPPHLLSGNRGTGTEIKVEIKKRAANRYSDGTIGYRLTCKVSVSTCDLDGRWRERSKVFLGNNPASYFTKRPGQWVPFVHGGVPTAGIIRWLKAFPAASSEPGD